MEGKVEANSRLKKYFKIGEIARELNVETHVLRYWETEFDELSPHKTRSGQRSYDRQDLDLLRAIRWLLYDEMYTIAGARLQLARMKESGRGYSEVSVPEPTQQNLLQGSEQERRIRELEQECDALRAMQSHVSEDSPDFGDVLEVVERERDELAARVSELLRDAEEQAQRVEMVEAQLRSKTEELAWLGAENTRLQETIVMRGQNRRAALGAVRRELERLKDLAV